MFSIFTRSIYKVSSLLTIGKNKTESSSSGENNVFIKTNKENKENIKILTPSRGAHFNQPTTSIENSKHNAPSFKSDDELDVRTEFISGTGFITYLELSKPRGVIDEIYYFNSSILPSIEFQVGTPVSFRASRSSQFPSWEVTHIQFNNTNNNQSIPSNSNHFIRTSNQLNASYSNQLISTSNPNQLITSNSNQLISKHNQLISRKSNNLALVGLNEVEKGENFVKIRGILVEIKEKSALINCFAKLVNEEDDIEELLEVKRSELPNNYEVQIGDLLTLNAELIKHFSSNNLPIIKKIKQIHSISPSNSKRFVSRLSLNSAGELISVENETLISTNHQLLTENPQLLIEGIGKYVQVHAVACKVNDFKWRATSISSSCLNKYSKDEEILRDDDEDIRYERSDELFDDKNGVYISPHHALSFPPTKIGSSLTLTILIQNRDEKRSRTLADVFVQRDQNAAIFSIDKSGRESDENFATIEPNGVLHLKITCIPISLGTTRDLLIFKFSNFSMSRILIVTCLYSDSVIVEKIRALSSPEAPIYPLRPISAIHDIKGALERRTIRGPMLLRQPFFSPIKLKSYKIPAYLWDIVEREDEEELIRRNPNIAQKLSFKNYTDKFHMSLWLEEIENVIRRRQYDLQNVILIPQLPYYMIPVPNLDFITPYVSVGDSLIVFERTQKDETNIKNQVQYQGTVRKLHDKHLFVQFSDEFSKNYNNNPVVVYFGVGRNVYRRSHHAIQIATEFLGETFLFPTQNNVVWKESRIPFVEIEDKNQALPSEFDSSTKGNMENCEKNVEKCTIFSKKSLKSPPKNLFCKDGLDRRLPSPRSKFISDTQKPIFKTRPLLKWFNQNLNEEQKNAVRNILKGTARPLPYVIFGPPGTGKTVTLIECVLQLLTLDSSSRLLITAPSNSVIDSIASTLLLNSEFIKILNPYSFIRLLSYKRDYNELPQEMREYCSYCEDLGRVLSNKRVVLSTCSTAGQLSSLGLENGHFSHVFVDEAGCATECETMIAAILMAMTKEGQMILAGDDKQLGPVLLSDSAKNLGLGVSFLERLMCLPLYSPSLNSIKTPTYNPSLLTQLRVNYRSHPSLLSLPSKLFYSDELISSFLPSNPKTGPKVPGVPKVVHNSTISPLVLSSKTGPEERVVPDVLHNSTNSPSVSSSKTEVEVPVVPNLVQTSGHDNNGTSFVSFGTQSRVLFHGVQGRSERERRTPSWFNMAEVLQIKSYVLTLLESGVGVQDIGIIALYRQQVDKIISCCELFLPPGNVPQTGTVEEFQGHEKKIILLSTVRSPPHPMLYPSSSSLSFIFSHKRFNVAITRAKCLLIVIGNPHVLAREKIWQIFIKYALELGGYRGCELPRYLKGENFERNTNFGQFLIKNQKIEHYSVENEEKSMNLDEIEGKFVFLSLGNDKITKYLNISNSSKSFLVFSRNFNKIKENNNLSDEKIKNESNSENSEENENKNKKEEIYLEELERDEKSLENKSNSKHDQISAVNEENLNCEDNFLKINEEKAQDNFVENIRTNFYDNEAENSDDDEISDEYEESD